MKILVTGGSGFIGTNYIDHALEAGAEVLSLDIKPPAKHAHQPLFRECDILDCPRLQKLVSDFGPTHVVHLAAKTGVHVIQDPNAFAANTVGVKNLIDACVRAGTVQRVVFTSSMLVCKVGYIPAHETDYKPTTAYGQSKVEGEKIVRSWPHLNFHWTIIRPTSVWGPWMVSPYIDLFLAIYRGWYMHIGHGHYKRTMGYVENVAAQIHSILQAPPEQIAGKTFYVGDPEPVDLWKFTEAIREEMGARMIGTMPYPLARALAIAGDILKLAGWHNVPLTSFRLNNIRTEYVFDLTPIVQVAGSPRITLQDGIRRSIAWMREMALIA